MAKRKLAPFFLRVRVCSSMLSTWVLNLAAFVPVLRNYKVVCNPGMNCHGCPWAAGACPIGVMAYGSAVHALPVYAISSVLALGVLLGRLTCAFLCPFGFLQDLLYKIPFFKLKLPRFTRYGKYLALALLVVVFPLMMGFEQSGFVKLEKPKVDKADAEGGEPQLDVTLKLTNLGAKPVTKPEVELYYTTDAKKELFRTRKEFADAVVAPGQTVTLPPVRVPNKLADAMLQVSSPQSAVEQTSAYQLYFCRLCPVGTLEATLPGYASGFNGSGGYNLNSGRILRFSILGAFLLLMLLVSRPFCRIFCPLGALYGLLTRFSASRISVDPKACVECGLCDRVCPVDLNVSKEVGGAECIACGDCAKVCPQQGIKRSFGL